MHGAQAVGSVWLGEHRLQIFPTLRARRRRLGARRYNLLHPAFRGHGQFQPVMRGKTEYPKEQFGIANRRRLLQDDWGSSVSGSGQARSLSIAESNASQQATL